MWTVTTDSQGTKMFINGNNVATNKIFFSNTAVIGKYFTIGTAIKPDGLGIYQDNNIGYFTGYIDDLRVYKRALNVNEVLELYNL
jgi:hypothetical protein